MSHQQPQTRGRLAWVLWRKGRTGTALRWNLVPAAWIVPVLLLALLGKGDMLP